MAEDNGFFEEIVNPIWEIVDSEQAVIRLLCGMAKKIIEWYERTEDGEVVEKLPIIYLIQEINVEYKPGWSTYKVGPLTFNQLPVDASQLLQVIAAVKTLLRHGYISENE